MAEETCSITYDDFRKNLTSGLRMLLETESFANVTLAVEGKIIRAHQMILSLYSPYFKALFENNPCQHPIFFLKDVRYQIMRDLLTFMYEGNVHIEPDDLRLFVDTAKALEIKGLAEVQSENGIGIPPPSEPVKPPEPRRPPERAMRAPEPRLAESRFQDPLALSSPATTKRPLERRDSPIPSTSSAALKVKLDESSTDLTAIDDVQIIHAPKKPKVLPSRDVVNVVPTREVINVTPTCDLINITPSTSRQNEASNSSKIIVHSTPKSEVSVSKEETSIVIPTIEYNSTRERYADPVDETIDLDDDDPEFGDNVKMEIEDSNDFPQDDEDDLLEPMPDTSAQEVAGYEGEPVTVTYWKTTKTTYLELDGFTFVKHTATKYKSNWRCTRCFNGNVNRNCKAVLSIGIDNYIILGKHEHDHDPFPLPLHSQLLCKELFTPISVADYRYKCKLNAIDEDYKSYSNSNR